MSVNNRSTAGSEREGNNVKKASQEIAEVIESNGSSKDGNRNSPYVESKIIALDVGSSATRFLVHSWMLRKSTPLFALASKEQPISLPRLDEGPAHTLIHYLYAGTFERRLRYTPVAKFQHSTCVYCAAVQYQLPSLVELSREEIVQAGESLFIFDILRVARDYVFPALPEDDVWFPGYLEDFIQKAMVKDPEPFRQPDFITRVEGNSRLLQIVWKTVMSNYAATPTSMTAEQAQTSGAETPMAESMLTESEAPTQDSQHQLPSPTESVVDSPPTSRGVDDLQEPKSFDLDSDFGTKTIPYSQETSLVASSDVTSNNDYDLPAIEPTVAEAKIPKTASVPPEDVKKPEHVRADSVVEADAVAPDNSFDDAKREVLDETPPLIANGGHDWGKKGKKKGKKKPSSIMF